MCKNFSNYVTKLQGEHLHYNKLYAQLLHYTLETIQFYFHSLRVTWSILRDV